MQYILTEQEYKKLHEPGKFGDDDVTKTERIGVDFNKKWEEAVCLTFLRDGKTCDVLLRKQTLIELLEIFQ